MKCWLPIKHNWNIECLKGNETFTLHLQSPRSVSNSRSNCRSLNLPDCQVIDGHFSRNGCQWLKKIPQCWNVIKYLYIFPSAEMILHYGDLTDSTNLVKIISQVGHQNNYQLIFQNWSHACIFRLSYGCTQEVGKHERRVRVHLASASWDSSFSSA